MNNAPSSLSLRAERARRARPRALYVTAAAAVLLPLVAAGVTGCATGTTISEEPEDDGRSDPPACPSPFEECGGDCVDPRTDERHCGACAAACASGEICVGGACEVTCSAPLIACEGACVDPQTDDDHCGAKGSCAGSEAGTACADTENCVAGGCAPACPAGKVHCDGKCIDPLTDAAHCGASGSCTGASAGAACQASTSQCPGALGEVCQAGKCVIGCAAGSKAFEFTGQVESFKVPDCAATLLVKAWGAQGGTSTAGSPGGLGGKVEGKVCVTPGTTLTIVVGEQAPSAPYSCGGGGGSYVADKTTPLFVAGGGGGGYNNWAPGGAAMVLATIGMGGGGQSFNDGGGGGGFTSNGSGTSGSGGVSFLNGAGFGVQFPAGNANASRGGFGGGGGASQSNTFNAGGGGGFNGGNAGNGSTSTGGSSFMSSKALDAVFNGGVRAGNGAVEISW